MRFFSKFTVLCNCCFLAAMVFRYFEMQKKPHGNNDQLIQLPWLESTLVTLGYGAIIVNVLFLLVYFIFVSLKVKVQVPKWMFIFNLLAFFAQVYFFFFN